MRDEEKNQSSNKSREETQFNAKSVMRKRWVLPAVYLGAAAIVLSTFFLLQGQNDTALPNDELGMEDDGAVVTTPLDGEAVPVTSQNEVFKMPVADENEVEVVGHFYDYDASPEDQQAALVYYNNTYYQNKGIDLKTESGESFDVTAALSGTIVKAEKDSLLGYVVQINHDNGVVTHYQSLEGVEVEEGQQVKQGDLLGKAGRNQYNADAGVHLHFEIRHDGLAVNPLDFMNQNIETLVEAQAEEAAESEESAEASEENEAKTVDEEEPVESEPAE